MAVHAEISPAEAADRLAIRELFDAYAHCADRRDAEGQKALFTTGTRFAVYMSGPGHRPDLRPGRPRGTDARLRGPEPVRGDDSLQRTEHRGARRRAGHQRALHDRASPFTADGERKIIIASLRYLDTFAKTGDTWLFAERNLILDWERDPPIGPVRCRAGGAPDRY